MSTKKTTAKRKRSPAQIAATKRMLAANKAKRKKPAAKTAVHKRATAAVKTVRVVASPVKTSAKMGPCVQVSDNGKTWKTVCVFQSAAMAKEYAMALYEKHDGKKYVRVI